MIIQKILGYTQRKEKKFNLQSTIDDKIYENCIVAQGLSKDLNKNIYFDGCMFAFVNGDSGKIVTEEFYLDFPQEAKRILIERDT
jgi:hypothetical protein